MKCERCGEEIRIRHPYLSRADDSTQICWLCGEHEAYLCINMLSRNVPKEEKIKALQAFLNTWIQEYTYNDVTYLRDGSVKSEKRNLIRDIESKEIIDPDIRALIEKTLKYLKED